MTMGQVYFTLDALPANQPTKVQSGTIIHWPHPSSIHQSSWRKRLHSQFFHLSNLSANQQLLSTEKTPDDHRIRHSNHTGDCLTTDLFVYLCLSISPVTGDGVQWSPGKCYNENFTCKVLFKTLIWRQHYNAVEWHFTSELVGRLWHPSIDSNTFATSTTRCDLDL